MSNKNNQVSTLAGWGRLAVPGRQRLSEDLHNLTQDAVLTRGLGRSYGDSSLPPPGCEEVVCSVLANRILEFDPNSGHLRAEAGLSLEEINRIFLPRGYFSPVTPGTHFVTLGGMVASDVHGKNHHQSGCFGEHVTSLKLRVADGRIIECSRESEPELFWATIGGMGLTGHILEVAFPLTRVPSPWIYQETERIPNLDTFISALKDAASQWPFTVGWIDCLSRGKNMGRGILYRGRWATPEQAPNRLPQKPFRITIPIDFPSWLLNPLTIRAFNSVIYNSHIPRIKKGIVDPYNFFYPLDKILDWNRLYGKRGFTQYQAVFPEANGREAPKRFLKLLTELGCASFLCVIKDCGTQGQGILSFPMTGVSVALDIPMRQHTPQHIQRLNAFVIEQGGRIYLTKDSFTSRAEFAAMEPRLDQFIAIRKKWDPEYKIQSAQSVRML
jgi:FAD/FMN-containing dehydrogenase